MERTTSVTNTAIVLGLMLEHPEMDFGETCTRCFDSAKSLATRDVGPTASGYFAAMASGSNCGLFARCKQVQVSEKKS